MIKFAKKWGHVYAPPSGKFEKGEINELIRRNLKDLLCYRLWIKYNK